MIAFTPEDFDFQELAIQHIKGNWQTIKARNGRVIGYKSGEFTYKKRSTPKYLTYGRCQFHGGRTQNGYGWSVFHETVRGELFHEIDYIRRGLDHFSVLESEGQVWGVFQETLKKEIQRREIFEDLEMNLTTSGTRKATMKI